MRSPLNAPGTLLVSSLLFLSILAVRVLVDSRASISKTSFTEVLSEGQDEQKAKFHNPRKEESVWLLRPLISPPVYPEIEAHLNELVDEVRAYERAGNYPKAFQYQQTYRRITDSLNSAQISFVNTTQRQPLIRQLKTERDTLSHQLSLLWIGLGTTGLLIIVLTIGICRKWLYAGALQELAQQRSITLRQKERQLSRIRGEMAQCVYLVSHDIQQPFTTISSYIRLFQRRYQAQLAPTAGKYLQQMEEAALWGNLLLRDLLYKANITRPGEPQVVDLHELICEVLTETIREISESNATICVGKNFPTLKCYQEDLKLLISQLIKCSLDNPGDSANSYVYLRMEKEEQFWSLKVEWPGETLPVGRNNEPLLLPSDDIPGQRYGLAICEKILSMNGGSLRRYAVEGEGITLEARLPLNPPTVLLDYDSESAVSIHRKGAKETDYTLG